MLDAQGKELKRGQKIGNEKGLRFMTEDARLSVVNKNGTYILNKSGKRSVERD